MISRLVILILLVLPVSYCGGTADPDLRLARQFIDAYYVMADQNSAFGLSKGFAQAKIKKEISLLKEMKGTQSAYRTRDILFKLLKEKKSKKEAMYFFELTIKIPGMEDSKRMVNVTIDRTEKRVKYFGELK